MGEWVDFMHGSSPREPLSHSFCMEWEIRRRTEHPIHKVNRYEPKSLKSLQSGP